jgi:hypothetical protein
MHRSNRVCRISLVSLAALILVACAGQKEPAAKLIGDIQASVTAASTEAAKYIPDQLMDVQQQLDALKASFAKKDYAAVISGAPPVLAAAQSLATAAAEKKDAALKALDEQWTGLAGSVPEYLTAIQSRIDLLGKKAGTKAAAGIDLDGAKAASSDAMLLWSKAQAAFATGNLAEAVKTAQDVKAKAEAAAASLKLDLSAPAAKS